MAFMLIINVSKLLTTSVSSNYLNLAIYSHV